MKPESTISLVVALVLLILPLTPAAAQTSFYNNGAVIGIGQGAQLRINGDMLNAKTVITFSTSATLQVNGNATVTSGTVAGIGTSDILVTGNLRISNSTAAVFRGSGGLLRIQQRLIVVGELTNEGTTIIGP